jgi:DNA-binding CsgD family transcriptional regulator
MIREEILAREQHKVVNYIETYVTRAGAENKEEVLELFDSIYRLFPHWVLATCPMAHPEIYYVSENAPHVFGYSSDYLIKHARMEKFFAHIHESDQADLYDCFSYMRQQLQSIPPSEHHEYRVLLHYRFRKPNGQYIHLHDEKAILDLRGGNLYYVLFRDITEEKIFSGVKAELFRQRQSLVKIDEYKPGATRNPLSKREKELLSFIKQGLSTKEIAWHLNISPNTVRNIKSKLFEKYNVGNSIELLNIAT